jgi:hypothetical protein
LAVFLAVPLPADNPQKEEKEEGEQSNHADNRGTGGSIVIAAVTCTGRNVDVRAIAALSVGSRGCSCRLDLLR